MDEQIVETNPLSVNESKKRMHVTFEQKEYIIKFVTENPEIITHSSTKENEQELWNVLEIQLNNLQPAKPLGKWKNFWNRWQTRVMLKPEYNLKVLDCRLKSFLMKIMKGCKDINKKESKLVSSSKTHLTLDEINHGLVEVEKERSKLNLEVDNNDFKILKYKSTIKALEIDNATKRKLIKRLLVRKACLTQKKLKIEK